MAENKNISLTSEDLKELLSTVVKTAVEESRKPFVSEAEQRRTEQDQADRKQQAALTKQMIDNKKTQQRICSHERRDGSTTGVYVTDDLGGFILCQRCQAVIRAGEAPKGDSGDIIYDTALFNRLFQKTSDSGIFA